MPKISREKKAAKSIARAWRTNFSKKTTPKLLLKKNTEAKTSMSFAKQTP